MSTEAVQKELNEFLESGEPGVFVLKGKWGTGKTHLIRKIVSESRGSWSSKKCAYISLFGVNSLDQLREDIFVALEGEEHTEKTAGKLQRRLREFARSSSGKSAEVGNWMLSMGSLFTKFWIANAVKDSKIIVDDIERRGDNLSFKILLGFFDQLKEQKNCQIVLIFNEGELDKGTLAEFDTYREKVVDRELELAPNVDEVIKLGFKKNDDVAKEVLRQLEVDNIRAVQKIEKFLERLEPFISHLSQGMQDEFISSAVRLSWFYFVRDRSRIPWSFIKGFKGYSSYLWEGVSRQNHGAQKTNPMKSWQSKKGRGFNG